MCHSLSQKQKKVMVCQVWVLLRICNMTTFDKVAGYGEGDYSWQDRKHILSCWLNFLLNEGKHSRHALCYLSHPNRRSVIAVSKWCNLVWLSVRPLCLCLGEHELQLHKSSCGSQWMQDERYLMTGLYVLFTRNGENNDHCTFWNAGNAALEVHCWFRCWLQCYKYCSFL